jgi:hypothetical protein
VVGGYREVAGLVHEIRPNRSVLQPPER